MKATTSAISLASLRTSTQRIDHEIEIGKDVLELVTGAMYVDPLTIFREYVQNAADAIDEGRRLKLFNGVSKPSIEISFDQGERVARIRDNGVGVPSRDFSWRLTAIGASKKRGTNQRGFRGVGRLAGLGYAQEIVFRSRSAGDPKVLEITWSGRKLRECLRSNEFTGDLASVIREVTEVATLPGTEWPAHFFEVELRKVGRVRNDVLMNPQEISSYLAQVAPVPFSASFPFKDEIDQTLAKHGIGPGINIVVDGQSGPLERPFEQSIVLSEKTKDRFRGIEFFEVPGVEGGIDAIGYLLHHSYFGALPKCTGIAGFRARVGNMQIGGPAIFDFLFSEQRFNSWCIGEIHILSDRLIPNGRRDDFETNVPYQNFQAHVAAVASRVSKLCREKSILRNRLRQAQIIFQNASDRLAVIRGRETPSVVRRYYREAVLGAITQLDYMKTRNEKLRDEERALIDGRIKALEAGLAKAHGTRQGRTWKLVSARKQRALMEFVGMMLDACDSPEEGAALAKRILDRARRVKKQ